MNAPEAPALLPALAHVAPATTPESLLGAVAASLRQLVEVVDLECALAQAVKTLGSLSGHDRSYLWKLDEANGLVRLLYEWHDEGSSDLLSHMGGAELPLAEFDEVMVPLRRGEIYGSTLHEKSGANLALNQSTGTLSDLMAPVFVDGQLWGVVGVDATRMHRLYSVSDREALRSVGDAMAAVIGRDLSYRQAEHADRGRLSAERLLAACMRALRELVSHDDLQQGLEAALVHLGEQSGHDRAYLFAFDQREEFIELVAAWNAGDVKPIASEAPQFRFRAAEYAQLLAQLDEGRPYHGQPERREGVSREFNERLKTFSDLIVGVRVDGRLWGMLGLDSCHIRHEFGDAEVDALRTTAEAIAAAVQRDAARRAHQAGHVMLREREALLSVVTDAARTLLAGGDLDASATTALRLIGEALGVHRVASVENIEPPCDTHPGRWRIRHEWAAPGYQRQLHSAQSEGLHPARGNCYERWQAGETIAFVHEYGQSEYANEMLEIGARSTLTVPVFVRGQLWGLLGFDDNAQPRTWAPHEMAVLETAAACFGTALQRHATEQDALAAERARNAEARSLNRTLEGVVAASHALHGYDDFQQGLSRWLELLALSVGSECAYQGWFGTDGHPYLAQAWRSLALDLSAADFIALPVPASQDFANWIERINAGEWVRANLEDLQDAASREYWRNTDCGATLIAPIRHDGGTIGWIGFDWCRPQSWDEAQIAVLRTAADVFVTALLREEARQQALAERDRRLEAERDRAAASHLHVERMKRHAALLAAVACGADELLASGSALEGAACALTSVGPVAGAQRAALALLEWTPDDPNSWGWQTIGAEWTAEGAHRQMASAFARFPMRRTDRTWQMLLDQLAERDYLVARVDELDEPFRSEQLSLAVRWTLLQPVRVRGQLRALIGFDFGTEASEFEDSDRDALRTLATLVASAMARDDLQQRALSAERERTREATHVSELLAQVVRGSRLLIDATPDEFEKALLGWLEGLAQQTGAQRATFYDRVHHEEAQTPTARMLCEWVRPGVTGSVPVSFEAPYVIDPRGGEKEMARLLGGDLCHFHTEELTGPMRDFLLEQGNATVCSIAVQSSEPTHGTRHYLSFDFAEHRETDTAETLVLRTAADSLAAVLRRNEAVQSLLAEREARLQEQLERSRELGLVNEALQLAIGGIARHARLEDFLKQVLKSAMDLMGANSGAVASFDAGAATHLVLYAREGWVPEALMRAQGLWKVQLDDPTSQGFLDLMPRSDRHWITSPVIDWMPQSFRDFHHRQNTQSLCLVPLMTGERLAGWMGLGFSDSVSPTQGRADVLRVLADQINVAMEFDRAAAAAREAALFEQRAQASQQLAAELARTNLALRRSVARLADSRDLSSFLHQLMEEACTLLRGSLVQIALYDAGDNSLRPLMSLDKLDAKTQDQKPWGFADHAERVSADVTPAWRRLLDRNLPVAFSIERDAADFWPGLVDFHKARDEDGSLCTAMRLGNEVIGVFGMAVRNLDGYTEAELEVLQVFAQQAGLAIQIQRHADDARSAAIAQERDMAAQTRLAALQHANDALRRSALSLRPDAPIAEFLSAALLECTAGSGARSGGAFVFDEIEKDLRMVAFVCDGQPVSIDHDPRMGLWRESVPQTVAMAWMNELRDRDHLSFDNRTPAAKHPWPISRDWHAALGHTHIVDVPLRAGGQLVGLLGQCFCGEEALAGFDLLQTQTLAHLAALALHQERLAKQARTAMMERERERAERERLSELARATDALRSSVDALAEADDAVGFLRGSLQQIEMAAGARTVWLFSMGSQDGLLRLIGSCHNGQFSPTGETDDPVLFRTARVINPKAAERIRASGNLLWRSLTEPVDTAEYQPEILDWHRTLNHKANALQALMIGDRQVGMVGMVFDHDRPPQERARELIRTLSQPLALALELIRLGQESTRSVERAAVLSERNRLAREIHDGIAQSFLAIQMQLSPLDSESSPAAVHHALTLARHGLQEARRAVHALRPQSLDGRKLPDALISSLPRWVTGANLHVQIDQPETWHALADEVEDQLFRLVQESVHNTVKHANAKTLRIELTQALNMTSVLIADDGVGFEPAVSTSGFGLQSMRQRARLIDAHIQWQSGLGQGTRVLISLNRPVYRAGPPD